MFSGVHVDPIQVLILLGSVVAFYARFIRRESVTQDTVTSLVAWTTKHGNDCEEYKRDLNKVLTAIQVSNAKLEQLATLSKERLDRLEG